MKFSYNWLQSFFNKKLPNAEKLANYLMMHSFEIEEAKKEGDDFILDIDILPNRMPDCASHQGIARELSAILRKKINFLKYDFIEDKSKKVSDYLELKVEDKKLCSRYCARIIEGVKVGKSPAWIKEKLEVCGLQSINNIVDATNYIMLETGQPLHAFDAEKLKGKIIVRKAKRDEKIKTLEEKDYILSENDLVIADEKEPIAIAGIKGGKKAEITKSTKTIIIESANFNREFIYRTSKRLNLRTDASIRFSAGLDPNLAEEAIDRVASLIQKIAGGKVLKGKVDFYPQKVNPIKINLRYDYLKSLLGIDISKKEVIKILESLYFEAKEKANNFIVKVPTFRRDILIEEDLIEEIGRIYGYEKFPSTYSILQKNFPEKNYELDIIFELEDLMKSFGFFEMYNYSFISEKEGKLFSKMKDYRLIELLNPISKNIKYLRFSLLPNLLKAVSFNEKKIIHEFGREKLEDYLRFYEVGNVFQNRKEIRKFAFLMGGENKYFELKGVLEGIVNFFNLKEISFLPLKENIFFEKKEGAQLILNKKIVGVMGKISREILDFYDIKTPIYFFEGDFHQIFTKFQEKKYKKIPVYPPVIRDISIIVPKEILAIEIEKIIESKVPKALFEKIEIIDVFYPSEGFKNITFRLIFRARNRNLTSEEVDKIQEKIFKEIEKIKGLKVKRKENL